MTITDKSSVKSDEIITADQLDLNFKYEVAEEIGGEGILQCFQCGTCTATCPVRKFDPDFNVRRIIRLTLLGAKEKVMTSDFVWLCSTCYSCYELCPQEVKITDVMTALKNIAVRNGHAPENIKGHIPILTEFGQLGEITEFENTIREKHGLNLIVQTPDKVRMIFEKSKIKDLIEGKGGDL
ncbi:MAG: 4Fe-4S dicluster domain-containing protein [Thermoplasmata archaeon]|nr:4Fe-4S dicluster domain-containing protein [Thermoplasmata archaeon]